MSRTLRYIKPLVTGDDLTRPPLVEVTVNEDELLSALQQNGWKLSTRKYKGDVRTILTKQGT